MNLKLLKETASSNIIFCSFHFVSIRSGDNSIASPVPPKESHNIDDKGIPFTLTNETSELTAVAFQITGHHNLVNFRRQVSLPFPRSLSPSP